MPATDDPFTIRSRVFPRFLGWALGVQLLLGVLVAVVLVERGVSGHNLVVPGEPVCFGVVSVFGLAVAFAVSLHRGQMFEAYVGPWGISRCHHRGGLEFRYRWDEILAVRKQGGFLGDHWFEVSTSGGAKFPLTARPYSIASVLDALERYAGPDHPLTLAMAEVVEGGR